LYQGVYRHVIQLANALQTPAQHVPQQHCNIIKPLFYDCHLFLTLNAMTSYKV